MITKLNQEIITKTNLGVSLQLQADPHQEKITQTNQEIITMTNLVYHLNASQALNKKVVRITTITYHTRCPESCIAFGSLITYNGDHDLGNQHLNSTNNLQVAENLGSFRPEPKFGTLHGK